MLPVPAGTGGIVRMCLAGSAPKESPNRRVSERVAFSVAADMLPELSVTH